MVRTELLRELEMLSRAIDGGYPSAREQGELNDQVTNATHAEDRDL
ncbi:MAG: hypothetical protein ABSF89_15135 [Acidimicrobiales bacterium]